MAKGILTVLISASLIICMGAQVVSAEKAEYKLQPTDVLSITVHQQPDLTTKTRVTTDGYITFPLLGKIKVKGMTVQELEREIKDLLEKEYLINAQTLVFIEEYHPKQISVIGDYRRSEKPRQV